MFCASLLTVLRLFLIIAVVDFVIAHIELQPLRLAEPRFCNVPVVAVRRSRRARLLCSTCLFFVLTARVYGIHRAWPLH